MINSEHDALFTPDLIREVSTTFQDHVANGGAFALFRDTGGL